METISNKLADMILKKKAFKFASKKEGGFKLKLHEKNPNAPLSPFFINLRGENHPNQKGPLSDNDFSLIAHAFKEQIQKNNLEFDFIAGLPYAGNPIADALGELLFPFEKDKKVIRLAKTVNEDGRKIVLAEGFEYTPEKKVLLVDDLITSSDSKLEAIEAFESCGMIVSDLLVVVDREQGGKEKIKSAGYNLIACLQISRLLNYYLVQGDISKEIYLQCLQYIGAI